MSVLDAAAIVVSPDVAREAFNREPFALEHNLSGLDLFAPDSLLALARKYAGHDNDFFVAAGAPAPGADFYSVGYGQFAPHEALEHLDAVGQRILLKRPENYDPRFRRLITTLYAQVSALRGGPPQTPVRLDSSIFITSAAKITPFHFDPEITFFFQIQGAKIYHLYSPQTVLETELEAFYVRGVLNIGQLDLARRDAARETVFTLAPGLGLHQPENTPHWVETCAGRSISFAISFETESTRRLGRTRAFNHYARRVGLSPHPPGLAPRRDALKSNVMQIALPLRGQAGRLRRRFQP